MTLGYRSNDAVITICQNNTAKSIEIYDLNKVAEDMLGFKNSELAKKPLSNILPPRIGEMLSEYVEYEPDANDVGEVLSKVQSFSIVGKDGKETGYRLKVVRDTSSNDSIAFKLVLQDKAGLRQNEALRKVIQENFKGHQVLDPELGLPDKNSIAKDIELISHYNNKSTLRSSFAIMQLDHYNELFSQYGRPVCQALLKHIAQIARQSLRPDDVVGSISHKRVGVLLVDTTPDSSRLVFNRLRWQIAANPFLLPDKTTLGLSVSISFGRIGGRLGDKGLIGDCEMALDGLGAAAVNALAEIGAADQRKASE